MTAVHGSSNVAAAEWTNGLFRVQFKDGSKYSARVGWEVYREFLSAPSKGRFIAKNLTGKLLRICEPVMEPVSEASGVVMAPVLGPVNSIDEDECCAGGLSRALLAAAELQSFTCPKCGTDWKPADVDGFRRWSPLVSFAILKRR